jgi:tetratricopeptide (TPR) repeat protein
MVKSFLCKPIFHVVLIVLLSFLAYSNTFHASFHFDDTHVIVNNPIIKDLPFFFKHSKAEDLPNSIPKGRYIGYLTFAINYKLHGLDVTGYHICNILIHILNAILVYSIVLLTLKTPYFSSRIKLNNFDTISGTYFIALFSALFFVSHPVQTQAVTYITQRFASLATMFYLLSIVMYIKARLTNDGGATKSPELRLTSKSALYYVISVMSSILAMKTKEMSFTLPLTLVLYEFMFLVGKLSRRILYLIPLLLTMLIIPLNLIDIDKPAGDLIGDVSDTTRVQTDITRWGYLFTQFRVIVTYIRLIFMPINQNLDYDYSLYHSLFNNEVLLSFLFLLTILGVGVYLYYRYRYSVPHTRLIVFGIFWFFITLSVESSIIPIVDVIYEHRVYLPSIGVFLSVTTSLFIVAEKLRDRYQGIYRIIVGTIAVIIVVLSTATYARNRVWQDDIRLWEDVVRKSPDKPRGYFGLGSAHRNQGHIDKAIGYYQIFVKLDPYNKDGHNNLGSTYLSKGRLDKAVEHFKTATNIDPNFNEAHSNLGVAYQSKGLFKKAIEHYRVSIKIDPSSPEAHNNLGNTYRSQGLIDKAIEHYQIALKVDPNYSTVYYNLGEIYDFNFHNYGEAIKKYSKAIELNPVYAKAYNNRGAVYAILGDYYKALEDFDTVIIKLNKKDSIAYYNRGHTYKLLGNNQQAIKDFQSAARLGNKKAYNYLKSIGMESK